MGLWCCSSSHSHWICVRINRTVQLTSIWTLGLSCAKCIGCNKIQSNQKWNDTNGLFHICCCFWFSVNIFLSSQIYPKPFLNFQKHFCFDRWREICTLYWANMSNLGLSCTTILRSEVHEQSPCIKVKYSKIETTQIHGGPFLSPLWSQLDWYVAISYCITELEKIDTSCFPGLAFIRHL